ncbi:MAG: preprotein translocase subunit SecG [Candidatus Moranbacteria bacterium]|nr:preprotein translocase subunit SecG [Candidatus Moranbacteria bacterium]
MKPLLLVQAIVSILLVVSILLQNRGTDAGLSFGGDFGGYYTKRGVEKFLFYAAIVLGIAFLVLSILNAKLT